MQLTIRQQNNATVTFCEARYDRMADILASALAKGSGTDDILFDNRILNFEVDGRETRKEVFTGIEFLGERERYTKIRFLPEAVRLVGVYTLSGNSVRVKMNCEKILENSKRKTSSDEQTPGERDRQSRPLFFYTKTLKTHPTQPFSETKTVILAPGINFGKTIHRVHQKVELLLVFRRLLLNTDIKTFGNDCADSFPLNEGKAPERITLFRRVKNCSSLFIHKLTKIEIVKNQSIQIKPISTKTSYHTSLSSLQDPIYQLQKILFPYS